MVKILKIWGDNAKPETGQKLGGVGAWRHDDASGLTWTYAKESLAKAMFAA